MTYKSVKNQSVESTEKLLTPKFRNQKSKLGKNVENWFVILWKSCSCEKQKNSNLSKPNLFLLNLIQFNLSLPYLD